MFTINSIYLFVNAAVTFADSFTINPATYSGWRVHETSNALRTTRQNR